MVPSLHRHYPTSAVLRTTPPSHGASLIVTDVSLRFPNPSPWDFPCCARHSPSTHATANTPTRPQGAYFTLFPCDGAFPASTGRSARAFPFSRRAQHSLTLWPACSPRYLCTPLHQRLQPVCYLPDCSSCFRSE